MKNAAVLVLSVPGKNLSFLSACMDRFLCCGRVGTHCDWYVDINGDRDLRGHELPSRMQELNLLSCSPSSLNHYEMFFALFPFPSEFRDGTEALKCFLKNSSAHARILICAIQESTRQFFLIDLKSLWTYPEWLPCKSQDHAIPVLTRRELDVLHWLMKGKSNWEIGQILFISEATTKTHVTKIFKKMRASNRSHVIVRAIELGLVPLSM